MKETIVRHAVGVDFGGTSVKLALVNDRGQIKARKSVVTKELPSKDAWVDTVATAIEKLCERDGAEPVKLEGIGIGVPGFVDFEKGYIYDLPNVPGWKGVNLGDIMAKRTGLHVRIDNDVNAMAVGECTFGAGRTYQHAVFVTWGTGVGGGLLINNQLYRGAYSMAGEIGHISIDRNGIQSPTGFGGVEQYVGNRQLSQRAVKALDEGRKSVLQTLCGGDRSQISPKLIKQAASQGDELAIEILDFATDCLATMFASLTYALQPQAFIIGGGIAEEADQLFELLRKNVNRRLSPHFAEKLEIRPAQLANDAGVIGCATLTLLE